MCVIFFRVETPSLCFSELAPGTLYRGYQNQLLPLRGYGVCVVRGRQGGGLRNRGSDWSTRVNHNTIACTSTCHVPLIGRVHLHISCTVSTNQSCCRGGVAYSPLRDRCRWRICWAKRTTGSSTSCTTSTTRGGTSQPAPTGRAPQLALIGRHPLTEYV